MLIIKEHADGARFTPRDVWIEVMALSFLVALTGPLYPSCAALLEGEPASTFISFYFTLFIFKSTLTS